jgi:hypothetical protein
MLLDVTTQKGRKSGRVIMASTSTKGYVLMNELETKMASILDELGQPYTPQYPIGERYFPGYCRSIFNNCRYRIPIEYQDVGDCECGGFNDVYDSCEWYVDPKSYPLYILDFAIFIDDKKVCIECDGFKWHYAYEYQKRNDSERDEYLRREGWIIRRFAGFTITRHR